jgi:putative oxidoreductase
MFDAVCKNVVVPLILRAGLALIFIYHGLGKVNAENNWGAAWATNMAAKQGQPVMEPLQTSGAQMAVAWGELIGGIAVALGFLTRLAALGIAAIMAGAIYTVHGQHGFSLQDHGYEYNFAILIICAALFFLGGGALAVDRIFRLRRRQLVTGR